MGNKQSNNKINPVTSRLSNPVNLMETKFVLGIIDPQYDFMRGGSLEVADANDIIGPINKLRFILYDYLEVFFSQDFHPTDHVSFASTHNEPVHTVKNITSQMGNSIQISFEQTLWPAHCVKGSHGCAFHKDLVILKGDRVFQKGTMSHIESYSAFGDEFANVYENTGLHAWCKVKKITDIVLVGLATDYCVYNTAKDAIRLGYRIHLILSCVRGVAPDTTKTAIDTMSKQGVKIYGDVEDFINANQRELEQTN
jgi:nicotinamidase/pyrazinamidase